MHAIRKPLARSRRCKTSELPAAVLTAFSNIENGLGQYTWAFELEEDAESFVRFSQSERFKSYPRPTNIDEAGTNLLSQLLPSHCQKVLPLEANFVCRHPYVGPRAGPGSVQTENPRVIPRESWLQAYGFGRGWLVLVGLKPGQKPPVTINHHYSG